MPWEDSIEVKNYKNKFEDLFSKITAEVEEMKKSEGVISSFSSGTLNSSVTQTIVNAVADEGKK